MSKRTKPYRRPKSDPGLQAAIVAVGGVGKLAKLMNISHAAVSVWERTPAERVPLLSKVTGIPRHVLRPDLYERPGVTA